MAFFSVGSRYIGGDFGEFDGEPVVFPPTLDFSNVEPAGSFTITVAEEYRLDLISLRVYGQTNLGWYIMTFNKLDNVSQLKRGVVLSIPPKSIVV